MPRGRLVGSPGSLLRPPTVYLLCLYITIHPIPVLLTISRNAFVQGYLEIGRYIIPFLTLFSLLNCNYAVCCWIQALITLESQFHAYSGSVFHLLP